MENISVEYASECIKDYCNETSCNVCALREHFEDIDDRPCWDLYHKENYHKIIENYNYLVSIGEIKEEEKMSKEMVKHPEHYNKEGRAECWDEMKTIFGQEAVAIFDILSAYKYLYRAGNKEGNPEEQDKAKIDNYMKHSADIIASADCTATEMSKARSCYRQMKKVLKSEMQ